MTDETRCIPWDRYPQQEGAKMDEGPVIVDVVQLERFRFRVEFPETGAPVVITDEPAVTR
ncbi:hypothetical protein [Burkholderia ubonensis]|uniref:hypothetical protein n=1 Tax=Burkholderia ubonensis TaxID=101571 RepID=UPI001E554613|nr:hypothetical protein [Burkholderia ubonensis]